jgi:allantoate deiminase
MRIDAELLERRLDELYAIGAEATGGAYRPLYSESWAAGCALVERWMREAALAVRRDAVGNLWGRIEGTGDGTAVVTGSHIDTVRHGGRLDGALGIAAGLTAMRALTDAHGPPKRPLELLVVCEEEGSRFNTNFWGSRAIIGAVAPDEADRWADQAGMTMARAMRERGLDPAKIPTAARSDLDAFVELHIEQGAILETTGQPLAVVSAIAGGVHLAVTVTGRADHAGTTPMDLRQDALVGAAAMVQAIASIAAAIGRPAVATVGKVRAEPDQINVVPGRVVFTVDLRHADLTGRRALEERIRSLCVTIAQERRLGLEIAMLHERPPVPMDLEIQQTVERAAALEGVATTALVSGAGHDAQILAAKCRVGMIFVPSRGGRSHSPEEWTDPADLETGTRVLARTLELLAY